MVIESSPWRYEKQFIDSLHYEGTPTLNAQPKLKRLSKENMSSSFYLSLSDLTL